MAKEHLGFKKGDSVKVKKGIMCPDSEDLCIERWQGRVIDIFEGNDEILIDICWDSITIKNMPPSYIDQSNEEGLDYSAMTLSPDEIEPAESRDSEKDVAKALREISGAHSWSWLGEAGKRIQKVLAGIDDNKIMELLKAWKGYLEKQLTFPFEAEIAEYQEKGPFKTGEIVVVKNIAMYEEHYGIIVHLKNGDIPLCELEVVDSDSANYHPVKDYCVWFANR